MSGLMNDIISQSNAYTAENRAPGRIYYTRSGAMYAAINDVVVKSVGFRLHVWQLESGAAKFSTGMNLRFSILDENGTRGWAESTRVTRVVDPQIGGLDPREHALLAVADSVARFAHTPHQISK